jgi:hypothetical protein
MSDEQYHGCLDFLSWCSSHEGNAQYSSADPVDNASLESLELKMRIERIGAKNIHSHLPLLWAYQQVVRGQAIGTLPRGNPEIHALCASAFFETFKKRLDLAAKETDRQLNGIKQQAKYLNEWLFLIGGNLKAAPDQKTTPHPTFEPMMKKYADSLLAVIFDLETESETLIKKTKATQIVTNGIDHGELYLNGFNLWMGAVSFGPHRQLSKHDPWEQESIPICDPYSINPYSDRKPGLKEQVHLPFPKDKTKAFREYLTRHLTTSLANAARLNLGKLSLCYDDVHFEVSKEVESPQPLNQFNKAKVFLIHGPISFTLAIVFNPIDRSPFPYRNIDLISDRFVVFGFRGEGSDEKFLSINHWGDDKPVAGQSRYEWELLQSWNAAIIMDDENVRFQQIDRLPLILRATNLNIEAPWNGPIPNPEARVQRKNERSKRWQESPTAANAPVIDQESNLPEESEFLRERIGTYLHGQRTLLALHLAEKLEQGSLPHSTALEAARSALESTVALGMPESLAKKDHLHALFFGKNQLPNGVQLAHLLRSGLGARPPFGTKDLRQSNYQFETTPEGRIDWSSKDINLINSEDPLLPPHDLKSLGKCAEPPATRPWSLTRWWMLTNPVSHKAPVDEKLSLLKLLLNHSQTVLLDATDCMEDLLNASPHEQIPLLQRAALELKVFAGKGASEP